MFPWLHGQDFSVLDWKAKMALLDERLLNEWQLRWDRAEHGSVTREFFPEAAFVYKRKDIVFTLKAGFLLTGHGSMNAFLQGRTLSTTTACSCGVERTGFTYYVNAACTTIYGTWMPLESFETRKDGSFRE